MCNLFLRRGGIKILAGLLPAMGMKLGIFTLCLLMHVTAGAQSVRKYANEVTRHSGPSGLLGQLMMFPIMPMLQTATCLPKRFCGRTREWLLALGLRIAISKSNFRLWLQPIRQPIS